MENVNFVQKITSIFVLVMVLSISVNSYAIIATGDEVVTRAESYPIGTHVGQCKAFVQQVFAEVGITLGAGYRQCYLNAGFEIYQHDWVYSVVLGDVIQISNDLDPTNTDYVHTAIVTVNNHDGTFGVIESNVSPAWQEKVGVRSAWDPILTAINAGDNWSAHIYRISALDRGDFSYGKHDNCSNTCYGSILGGEEFNWIYWCNAVTDVFEQGYTVKSLVEINAITEEFRFKVETWQVGSSSSSWGWPGWWSDPGSWGWDRSYFSPEFRDAPAGDWEFRIFVDTVDDGANDFIHIDTLHFTIEKKNYYYDHHSYRGRNWSNQVYDYKGHTCYGPVTGGASTNWEYTCNGFEHGKTPIQSTFFTGDRVYALVEINDIRSDFRMKSEIYHKDLYNNETLKYIDIGWLQNVEWLWDRAYYFPYIDTDAPGEWRFEIYIDAGYGYEWIDTINFIVHDSLIESYQYKRNGTTCYGPVVGGEETGWIYTCENEATIFDEGDTVQALVYTTSISENHYYIAYIYKDGLYYGSNQSGFITVEPYIWDTSYFMPTIPNVATGDWEIRVVINTGSEYEWIDTIKFSVI